MVIILGGFLGIYFVNRIFKTNYKSALTFITILSTAGILASV
jgi:hypothetical protein